MTPAELDAYLHAHIPLSRHMGLSVLDAAPDRIALRLPLAPNVNPHGTVFGGALAALGLVSAWTLLYVAFRHAGLAVHLVGKESRCEFLRPAQADCVALTTCAPEALAQLLDEFRARGRARHALETRIQVDGVDVVRHQGVYTALTPAVQPDAVA